MGTPPKQLTFFKQHLVCLARRHCRALAAYQDFLRLWKDADPDIPILKKAKAEYVKLQ